MGYMIEIRDKDVMVFNSEKAEHIIEAFEMDYIFGVSNHQLVVKEYVFKLPSEMYLFLAALAEVAEGEIEFQGEDNTIWKIELKNGKLTEYSATIVYEKNQEIEKIDANAIKNVAERNPLINERYAGVWLHKDSLMLYDLKEEKWYRIWLSGSVSDVSTINSVMQGGPLPAYYTYDPTPDEIRAFVEKIKNAKTDTAFLKIVATKIL